MENKNNDKKIYGSTVYDSFKSHQTEYQKLLLKKENQKNEFTEQDTEDLGYHKKRMDYIKKFAKGKQVPLVYVPDSCFAHECKPDTYSTIDSLCMKKNDTYDLDLSELLYPAWCYDEQTDKMLVENSQYYCQEVQDTASPYKPSESFLIKQQQQTVNTCYFMSLMIGIVSHGGEYIKNKMIRDYPENDNEEDDENLKGRSDKAVVHLFDEDGLPVDIVVDKTRPDGDTRAMWIIVLEKAACVMMSRNKFKNCYRDEISKAITYEKSFTAKSISKGIDWYDLGKGKNHEIDKAKINSSFNMDDMDYASESQGIKLILGKNYEQQWIKNKSTEYIDYIKKCIDSGKLVIVATGNSTAGKLNNTNHIFYVSSIDMDKKEITTIDSMSGKITTSFDEFLSHIVQIHVTDFPDMEKTIEQEIDLKKIQEIENEVVNKNIDDIDNTNKKINLGDKGENENKKDVQIENNENKNEGEEIKTEISPQNIKKDSMPAENNNNNLEYQMKISKQDNSEQVKSETQLKNGLENNTENNPKNQAGNDIKNENDDYVKLFQEKRFAEIGKGSIKSIGDLLSTKVKSNQIRELILNNSEAFADNAFVGFDLSNDDNKTKLGLTSNTPQSGRKRRIFLAVLLYICFGLGYFTGWSKKLLDTADSINQHNQYLAALNNLINTKSKNDPSLPNGKQVINKEKSKIGQGQNKTPETTNNQRPLHMVQENTQTSDITKRNEGKGQQQDDLC